MNVIKTILSRIYCLPFGKLGVLTLLGTAVFLLFYRVTRNQKWQRPALLALSAAYALVIVCATLLGRSIASESHGVSLLPFASYVKFAQGERELLRESLMNIVLFYPLGLFLGGAASGKLSRKKTLASAFFLSLFIELCQGLFNLGYVETDDVIHNTLGAGLGMLAVYVADRAADFVKLQHKRSA